MQHVHHVLQSICRTLQLEGGSVTFRGSQNWLTRDRFRPCSRRRRRRFTTSIQPAKAYEDESGDSSDEMAFGGFHAIVLYL